MVRDVYETALMWPTLVARLLLGHHDVLPRIRLTSFVASRESYSLANSHSRFGEGRGINSSYSGSYFFVFGFGGLEYENTTYSNSQRLVFGDPVNQ